ncbi:hypothetical protein BpHYR1_040860 [Brachionus plicatilis]|uniref:Uncharacterized protein n=1 Tax=Brachionus plicatilis TaxID=10195 RepID=A0A3M7PKV2_BRAPC|nr:hypothetical protein BpHYR1_040860 [Brachionus plicatilis]
MEIGQNARSNNVFEKHFFIILHRRRRIWQKKSKFTHVAPFKHGSDKHGFIGTLVVDVIMEVVVDDVVLEVVVVEVVLEVVVVEVVLGKVVVEVVLEVVVDDVVLEVVVVEVVLEYLHPYQSECCHGMENKLQKVLLDNHPTSPDSSI